MVMVVVVSLRELKVVQQKKQYRNNIEQENEIESERRVRSRAHEKEMDAKKWNLKKRNRV